MKKAFTLIEVVVVIVIIGILAALAMPQYAKTAERSRQSEAFSVLGAMRGAQQRYWAEHSFYTGAYTDLDVDFPLVEALSVPNGKFFNYTAVAGVSQTTSIIAQATRKSGTSYENAGYCGYTIAITGNGTVTVTQAGGCLDPPR